MSEEDLKKLEKISRDLEKMNKLSQSATRRSTAKRMRRIIGRIRRYGHKPQGAG